MATLRTGQFVAQLSGEARYKAFIPADLPFEIKATPELNALLSRADIAVGRLDGIAETLPDVDFFLLMYVRKEATLSSQIEGTQATFSDVLRAEAEGGNEETRRDVDEVINYIDAMNYGLERMATLPLSLRLIREIHERLLKGVRGQHRNPGEFRTSQNWVGGPNIATATYVPPPPSELTRSLGNMESYIYDTAPAPVLVKAGLLHAQFESIHPFLDGNGRIGRLLITLYLCQQGVLRKPLLYLSDFFKRNHQDYYDRLMTIRTADDVEGWLAFFFTGVVETAEAAVSTARQVNSLRQEDVAKVTKWRSAERALKLLDALYRTPLVRVADVERITGLSNPSALALVRRFEKVGILREITGRQRDRLYSYKKYVELFA
jgi:Fic family protein